MMLAKLQGGGNGYSRDEVKPKTTYTQTACGCSRHLLPSIEPYESIYTTSVFIQVHTLAISISKPYLDWSLTLSPEADPRFLGFGPPIFNGVCK